MVVLVECGDCATLVIFLTLSVHWKSELLIKSNGWEIPSSSMSVLSGSIQQSIAIPHLERKRVSGKLVNDEY